MPAKMLHAAGLGVLQGLTEFLPVSSSGHLALAESVLKLDVKEWVGFDVAVHVATMLAVLVYFRREVLRLFTSDRRLIPLIVLGSVPVAVVGFLWHRQIEGLRCHPSAVAAGFLATAAVLIAGDRVSKRFVERYSKVFGGSGRPIEALTLLDSILIGIAQAAAIIPGLSRSGATVGAGLMRGLDRRAAVTYSFLLSLPAVMGATILKAREIGRFAAGEGGTLAVGFAAALVTGIVALRLLVLVIEKGKLPYFAGYCAILGALTLVVGLRG